MALYTSSPSPTTASQSEKSTFLVWQSNIASRGVSSAALDDLDPSFSVPVIMAYGSDYAERTDILRFLKLESDGNLRIYSSPKFFLEGRHRLLVYEFMKNRFLDNFLFTKEQ
ncbi:hypothetical protein HYC85_016216 [Camellia sinensis]|uniref:Uncharacterized protein n=1 Tax=Camellia sinensis TaxID=4442 RepID=A0A7J7H2P0_CAMSI|nr:hypothetical protein HYC85_016216 [Camellia sinensis]